MIKNGLVGPSLCFDTILSTLYPSMVGFIPRLGSLPIRSSRTRVHVPHNEKGERELLVSQQSLKTLGFILIESAHLTCCQYVDRLALVPRGGGAQGQSPNNFLLHSVAGSNECWTCVSEQRWNSAAWHFENKRSATEMGQAPEWQGRAIRRLLLLREIIQNLENDSVNFQCLAEVCLTSLTEDKRLSGGKETSLAKGLEPMDFTTLWN